MCYTASTNTVGGLNNNENCKNEIRIASLLSFEITEQHNEGGTLALRDIKPIGLAFSS